MSILTCILERRPDLACKWLGHLPEFYADGEYTDRRGRRRTRFSARCARCGCGRDFLDDQGHLEWLAPWRLRRAVRERLHAARAWVRTDCEDCGKPKLRFGHPVADHAKCEEIPF